MAKRVLVFGTTGVKKRVAIEKTFGGIPGTPKIDFEKDYVVSPENEVDELNDYLDCSDRQQRLLWERAWKLLNKDLDGKYAGKDLVLLLHGVTARPTYGVRSPVYFDALKEFEPTQVISLIDDVYLKWWRTESHADELGDAEGRPTLEQLITARRSELFLADIVARNCGSGLKNYLLAVQHPSRTLKKILFNDDIKPIYLSFPIAAPKDMGLQNEINEFVSEVTNIEKKPENESMVCFCPLSIDELPLQGLIGGAGRSELVTMRLEQRWNVRDFWTDEALLADETSVPESIQLVREQVEDAIGLIKTDVSVRDFRLVAQSTKLAVFNPVFHGALAQGVASEIDYALTNQKTVHIYQDPELDPAHEADRWKPRGGAIRDSQQARKQFYDNRDQFIEAITA